MRSVASPSCPMNSVDNKKNKARYLRHGSAWAVSISLLLSFCYRGVDAQTRSQKRITSVWTATTAEGSRVHIDADAPVSDYEAYTRGDRFYVKIPSADLPSARGSLLGRGFDDVQIQRYGDGIIVSFRLQPGTVGHVEQASNRLEIVFVTPVRFQSVVSRTGSSEIVNRTRARRIADTAGPSPASPTGHRSTDRSPAPRNSSNERSARSNAPNLKTSGSAEARNTSGSSSKTTASDRSIAARQTQGSNGNSSPTKSPEPVSSPSPKPSASPTPAVSSTTAQLTSSPAATPISSPSTVAASPTAPAVGAATPVSNSDNDWASRRHYWKVWAELNWIPLLIGGMIGLVVLILLVSLFRLRRRRGSKIDSGREPASNREAPAVTVATKSNTTPMANTAPAVDAPSATVRPDQPASASSPQPLNAQKGVSEEQEREVFEL
jgi:hypothetical protein